MRSRSSLAAIASLVVGAVSIPTYASLINVDLAGDNGGSSGISTYEGPGVIGSNGDEWNYLNVSFSGGGGTANSLVTSTGSSTSIDFIGNFTTGPYNAGHSLWTHNPDATISTGGITTGISFVNDGKTTHSSEFTGLDPTQTYDLYVLTANDSNGRQALVSVSNLSAADASVPATADLGTVTDT
jgi:hypothetical protein